MLKEAPQRFFPIIFTIFTEVGLQSFSHGMTVSSMISYAAAVEVQMYYTKLFIRNA